MIAAVVKVRFTTAAAKVHQYPAPTATVDSVQYPRGVFRPLRSLKPVQYDNKRAVFSTNPAQVDKITVFEGEPFAQSGHVDVWPTLFEALGARWERPWASGRALLSSPQPLLLAGGLDFPFGNERLLIVREGDRSVLNLGQPIPKDVMRRLDRFLWFN